MNILVLNGSPAGENSITLQTVLYLEKLCKKVSFSYRSIRGRFSQSGDGSLIDKDGSTWYTAREVMTNAEESTDTCGEWNLSCHAPGNQLSANL